MSDELLTTHEAQAARKTTALPPMSRLRARARVPGAPVILAASPGLPEGSVPARRGAHEPRRAVRLTRPLRS